MFALFLATAMSISAIPVIAKVLMDLNLMRRDVGQAIIAAGMTDDAIGWMLLSVVLGLARAARRPPRGWCSCGGQGARLRAAQLHARPVAGAARAGLRAGPRGEPAPDPVAGGRAHLRVGGALAGAWGWRRCSAPSSWGSCSGRCRGSRARCSTTWSASPSAIFAPIFFAVAGLKVDVRALLEPAALIGIALLVIAVASAGQGASGGYAGARLLGRARPLDGAQLRRRDERARGDGDHHRHHRPLHGHPHPGDVLHHRADGDHHLAHGAARAALDAQPRASGEAGDRAAEARGAGGAEPDRGRAARADPGALPGGGAPRAAAPGSRADRRSWRSAAPVAVTLSQRDRGVRPGAERAFLDRVAERFPGVELDPQGRWRRATSRGDPGGGRRRTTTC